VRDGRLKAFCYGLGREPASDTNRVGCSVACLEREGWKKGKPHLNWPFKCGLITFETLAAKEARRRWTSVRKTPRLFRKEVN